MSETSRERTARIKAKAQELFDAMLTQGLTLTSMEARCDQVEIDAVQALRRGEITADQKQDYIDISFEVRRLAAKKFVSETLLPRRNQGETR